MNHYHSLMDSLNDAEFLLMAEQVQELRKVLHYGCKRLNWNFLSKHHIIIPHNIRIRHTHEVLMKFLKFTCSKGIPEFIQRGNQAISKFESLMNQIQKNEKDIEDKLKSFELANLFKFPAPDNTGHLPG